MNKLKLNPAKTKVMLVGQLESMVEIDLPMLALSAVGCEETVVL